MKSLSRVQLVATPWTAAYQAPPSMGLSRQEYWSGLPLPSLGKVTNKYQFRGKFLEVSEDFILVCTFLQILSMNSDSCW